MDTGLCLAVLSAVWAVMGQDEGDVEDFVTEPPIPSPSASQGVSPAPSSPGPFAALHAPSFLQIAVTLAAIIALLFCAGRLLYRRHTVAVRTTLRVDDPLDVEAFLESEDELFEEALQPARPEEQVLASVGRQPVNPPPKTHPD
eukprot:TRINITY_DN3790_c0_g1_i1.p2 TRINITY_DN3790_c0_g1~~TRINITY_DN3790_c0_g1_i1.p2  ORF type:complete len:144 (+),score=33.43 TRINITY_DN3790_c0_g1_i1:48-479(+)